MLNHLINSIFFAHHWGYFFVFLSTILEAMPFGFLVPGHAFIIFSGFLAKIKIFDLFDIIFIASLGAVLGDFINYYLGKKYGYNFLNKYGCYFLFKKEYLDKTVKMMNEHTGKTLIIGRFNSITRSFAPFVAGTSNIPLTKFLYYNLIGGFSWATSSILIGYIFGHGFKLGARYFGTFSLAAIIFAVFIVYVYKFINKRRHIFAKYDFLTLSLNVLSLYIFFKMAEDVIESERIVFFDFYISRFVAQLWHPLLNQAMIAITRLMNYYSIIIIFIALSSALIILKRWRHLLQLSATMGGGMFVAMSAKMIFHRLRPDNSLIEVSGFSFPSYHAVTAIIFLSLMIYFFKDDIKNKILKIVYILFCILAFLQIGLSRVYLNVHWLSDVIAGFALGLFWVTLMILIFKYTSSIVQILYKPSVKK